MPSYLRTITLTPLGDGRGPPRGYDPDLDLDLGGHVTKAVSSAYILLMRELRTSATKPEVHNVLPRRERSRWTDGRFIPIH